MENYLIKEEIVTNAVKLCNDQWFHNKGKEQALLLLIRTIKFKQICISH